MAKIAVIEDDAAIAEMYRVKFVKDGHQVETANSGKQGLAMIESFQPDIVLLDIVLPDIDGDKLLRQIRQTGRGRDAKVIILTNADEQTVSEATDGLGVSAIIVKAKRTPSQVEQIIKEVLK